MIMNDLSLFPQQRYWNYASDPNSLFGVLGEDNTMQSEAAKQENNPEDAREAQRTLVSFVYVQHTGKHGR